jgi:hypothetical protein
MVGVPESFCDRKLQLDRQHVVQRVAAEISPKISPNRSAMTTRNPRTGRKPTGDANSRRAPTPSTRHTI